MDSMKRNIIVEMQAYYYCCYFTVKTSYVYLQLSSHHPPMFLRDNHRYLLSIKCCHWLKPAPTHFPCKCKHTGTHQHQHQPRTTKRDYLLMSSFIMSVFHFAIFDCAVLWCIHKYIYLFGVLCRCCCCCCSYLTALIKLQSATPVNGPFCSLVLPWTVSIWQPAFSSICAYFMVLFKSSNRRILHVTGTAKFLCSVLTVNKMRN